MVPAYRFAIASFATVILSSSTFGQPDPLAVVDYPREVTLRRLWTSIKNELDGADGDEYFKSKLKGFSFPYHLKGVMISGSFDPGVSKITVSLTDRTTPDAVLMIHSVGKRVKGDPKPGTEIEFVGVIADLVRDPRMVVFDVLSKDVRGLEFQSLPSKKALSGKRNSK